MESEKTLGEIIQEDKKNEKKERRGGRFQYRRRFNRDYRNRYQSNDRYRPRRRSPDSFKVQFTPRASRPPS